MTTRTIRVLLPRAVALEVRKARLLEDLRLIQKNRARLDNWHEETVAKLTAVEKELKDGRWPVL
jgi:hypothetical protein